MWPLIGGARVPLEDEGRGTVWGCDGNTVTEWGSNSYGQKPVVWLTEQSPYWE